MFVLTMSVDDGALISSRNVFQWPGVGFEWIFSFCAGMVCLGSHGGGRDFAAVCRCIIWRLLHILLRHFFFCTLVSSRDFSLRSVFLDGRLGTLRLCFCDLSTFTTHATVGFDRCLQNGTFPVFAWVVPAWFKIVHSVLFLAWCMLTLFIAR